MNSSQRVASELLFLAKGILAEHTEKNYECAKCGYVSKQRTNHYGSTYSIGHFNTCPKCPPYAKYPEFGGFTKWICLDKEDK